MRGAAIIAVVAVAACGRGGSSSAPPVAAAVIDAGPRTVALVDAALADADAIAAEPVDAAAPVVEELGELRRGGHLEIFIRLHTTSRWRWRGPGAAVDGTVAWTASADDPDDWLLDLRLVPAVGEPWTCVAPDCAIACEPGLHCDLAIIAERDALVVATMTWNKGELIPGAAVRVRWRRGRPVATEVADACKLAHGGMWTVYCDGDGE